MWHWLFETQTGFVFLLVVGILVVLVVYALPVLLAWSLGSPYLLGITLLCLLLGWTVIGWIAALVWAMASGRDVAFDEEADDAVNADRHTHSLF
ncbi:superinfection immunity protein [Acidithiobacillus thiooxidans]|uniref:superinfection immunity protein n=1 Tax=Acidithiobacillus TaxID=119977 RepID=UPI0002624BFF|nr:MULTISPECIES: superinfection immunity protein [Acidithiobacillus]MBU2742675.1 superinfection immunity protein [Acidithiobacillus albertensis]MBU2812031.1 superinfection immunity protein [Acidithiobacillus thiooxidans]MBU2836938.1 superinfection immunity protein [Acidithiobacillus thiooxidans]